MHILLGVLTAVSSAVLGAWCWLALARGAFWLTDQRLEPGVRELLGPPVGKYPAVAVVVPARNEADVLPRTLPTLLGQEYRGAFHVFLVDDGSEDGTAGVALEAASATGGGRLTVVTAEPRPEGWTGKVWALA